MFIYSWFVFTSNRPRFKFHIIDSCDTNEVNQKQQQNRSKKKNTKK